MKVLPATAMHSRGADYSRTYHHIDVDPDATLEDILRPSFWAHHVDKFRRNDIVDVVTLDGGIDVQMRVEGKGIGYVSMRPMRIWQRDDGASASTDNPPAELMPPDGYVVNFAPKQGWRVMTKEPHLIVSRDHKSKAEAIAAALAHSAKANAVAA